MVKMSEVGGGEREFFGSIAKKQSKYGSTTKPCDRYSKYVRHIVCKTDTLMGLALKYGSTVSDLSQTEFIFDSCQLTRKIVMKDW